MDDKALLAQLQSEKVEGFSGDGVSTRAGGKEFTRLAEYRVANLAPGAAKEGVEAFKPGIKLIVKGGTKEDPMREEELASTVKAVILYSSHARTLGRGAGDGWQVVCKSHDGVVPSPSISKPLCNKASSADIAQTLSQWRGYTAAKIKSTLGPIITDDKLTVCGLKSATGPIPLCPYAKKDPDTGQAPACKAQFFLHCYDVVRKREFSMNLTGGSIQNNKMYVAPIFRFFQQLQALGGLPCFAFSVTLRAQRGERAYYLEVEDITPIAKPENREAMKQLALAAKTRYEEFAHRTPPAEETPVVVPPAPAGAVESFAEVTAPPREVSFNDDDINF